MKNIDEKGEVMKIETASGDTVELEAIRKQTLQNKELGKIFYHDPEVVKLVEYRAFCSSLRRSFGYGTQEYYVTVFVGQGSAFEICPVCGKTQDMCGFRMERVS